MRFGACSGILSFCFAATLSFNVQAVELGEEQVYSFLNEPFLAEIELNDWNDVGLDRIRIELASPQDFLDFNLPYVPELEDLEFSIEETSGGSAYIQVTGRSPLNEPYLDFLLRARWPGGSILREYVVLLDIPGTQPVVSQQTGPAIATPSRPVYVATPEPVLPPVAERNQPGPRALIPQPVPQTSQVEENMTPAPASTTTAVTPDFIPEPEVITPSAPSPQPARVQPTPVRPVAEAAPEPEVIQTSPQVAPRPATPAPRQQTRAQQPVQQPAQQSVEQVQRSVQVARSYRVQPGDSLWEIAQSSRSGDLTIYQAMVSIYEQNINSFVNRNITLLKINQSLNVPDAGVMGRLSATEARRVFDQLSGNGQARVDALKQGLPLPELTEFPLQLSIPGISEAPERSPVAALEQPPANDDASLATPFSNQSGVPAFETGEEDFPDSLEEPLMDEVSQVDALGEMVAEREEEIRTLEEQMNSMNEQLREAEANIQRLLDAVEDTPVPVIVDIPGSGTGTSGSTPAVSEVQNNSSLLKISVGVLGLLLLAAAGYIWKLKRENDYEDWDELEDMELPEDFEIEDDLGEEEYLEDPENREANDPEEGDYLAIVDLPEEGFDDGYDAYSEKEDVSPESPVKRLDALLNEVDEEISSTASLLDTEIETDSGEADPQNRKDPDTV